MPATVAPPVPLSAEYRKTYDVLYKYVTEMVKAGKPFYISEELNSTVLTPPPGFGFWPALVAAVTKVAVAVGPTVKAAAQVAAVANSFKSSGGQSTSSAPTADDIAAAVMPQVQAKLSAQGIQLPSSVAQQTVQASVLDSFGPQYHNVVLFGGIGLAALVLLKMARG